MKVTDGKGRGFEASVSTTNRLNVSAKTNPRVFYSSRDDGLGYNLTSIVTSANAGETVLYLKNTSSTRLMFVKQVHVASANAALWKSWIVTGIGSGTVLTATNLNLTSGNVAEILAVGDGAVTNLTTGAILDSMRTNANVHDASLFEDALILGENDAIGIEYDNGTSGMAEASIEFHYETIGAN